MPIYRYRCNVCGRITEEMASLKEGAPADHPCFGEMNYPKVNTQPEAWLDEPTVEPQFEVLTAQCSGTARRVYDSFQFHISGR